jgi:serine/threonine protein phosphatase PrpC
MFSWTSAALSNVGKRRKINEDDFLERPDAGLWVVADGMGGYEAGDVASQAITQALEKLQPPSKMSDFVDEVESRLLDVNTELYEMARKRRSTIGSTVVALLAIESHCVALWAGDSRAYRYRAGQLEPLSQDHSHVEELIEQGLLLRDEAENHPDANVITRAVGAQDELFLDLDIYSVQDRDIFLLCSDGLYKEITESEIAEVLSKKRFNCQRAAQQLIALALSRKCKDNVTVVIIQAKARYK